MGLSLTSPPFSPDIRIITPSGLRWTAFSLFWTASIPCWTGNFLGCTGINLG